MDTTLSSEDTQTLDAYFSMKDVKWKVISDDRPLPHGIVSAKALHGNVGEHVWVVAAEVLHDGTSRYTGFCTSSVVGLVRLPSNVVKIAFERGSEWLSLHQDAP